MKLYLAHPIDLRKEVREWQQGIQQRVPKLTLVNPFYDVNRPDIEDLDAGRRGKYEVVPNQIVTNDLHALRESNGIVAYFGYAQTIGTIMEIVYARMYRKPVYLIVTNGHHGHPWLRYHADGIFTSFEAFEEFIKSFLSGEVQ